MSESRTTIPEWELKQLRAITDAPTVQEREAALLQYLAERERRKRYARVRDARDRDRRTLVGAHMRRDEAERVAILAKRAGMSVTAYIKRAIEQAEPQILEQAEREANQSYTAWERETAKGGAWAAAVYRP